MNRVLVLAAALLIGAPAFAATSSKPEGSGKPFKPFTPTESTTSGTVSIAGHRIDYQAVAGTLVVHAKGWDDAADKSGGDDAKDNPNAVASMFYTAYFRRAADPARRPIVFLYNGGPGSSSLWLRMGAFGPVRVLTNDHSHTPAAPYAVVNN